MRQSVIWLFVFVLICCQKSNIEQATETPRDSISAVDTSGIQNEMEILTTKIRMLKKPKIEPLPFGCALLIEHEFPGAWASSIDDVILPHEKELLEIGQCTNKINSRLSSLAPMVGEMEYIRVGEYDSLFIDQTLLLLIDSCKYRLPDFGMYECYYFYSDNRNPWIDSPYRLDVGNLVLIHKPTRKSKVINVYTSLVYQHSALGRHFYISKESEISVFEYYVDDQIQKFTSVTKILISESGECIVQVKTINDDTKL
jgi:hypothetical protein